MLSASIAVVACVGMVWCSEWAMLFFFVPPIPFIRFLFAKEGLGQKMGWGKKDDCLPIDRLRFLTAAWWLGSLDLRFVRCGSRGANAFPP